MHNQSTRLGPAGNALTSAISVLISLSLLLSISWIGWDSLTAGASGGLFISAPA